MPSCRRRSARLTQRVFYSNMFTAARSQQRAHTKMFTETISQRYPHARSRERPQRRVHSIVFTGTRA
eukprot:6007238-Pleurochrysis_carterae.AAC.1